MLTRYINKFLHLFELRRVRTFSKVVYLTFDDGPDEGITEYVLDLLNYYNFKATFFCCGKNAERNPYLIERIRHEGHTIANHTYSHLNGFVENCDYYIEDVEKAAEILKTNMFRPPFGSLKLSIFIKLFFKYRMVYWSLVSGDSDLADFNLQDSKRSLCNTKKGEIILFHFCKEHENETRQLLPWYLDWLYKRGITSKAL